MLENFPDVEFEEDGAPKDLASARALAEETRGGRHNFESWAIDMVGAYPKNPTEKRSGRLRGRKGKDQGIDGLIRFKDDSGLVVVSVKSGKVSSRDMRDLRGTIAREKAEIGVLITLNPPTKDMRIEAAEAGKWHGYRRMQIITVAELLKGRRPRYPGWDVKISSVPPANNQIDRPGLASTRPKRAAKKRAAAQ